MKRTAALLAIAAGFSFSAMAANYKGYIIDQKCSTNPAMRGNVECATKCIKGGSPAVLVTDDGKIYKISNQAKVVDHAGQKVTINGKLKGDTLMVSKIS
jgi:Protein of unknown function (DUF5818)